MKHFLDGFLMGLGYLCLGVMIGTIIILGVVNLRPSSAKTNFEFKTQVIYPTDYIECVVYTTESGNDTAFSCYRVEEQKDGP